MLKRRLATDSDLVKYFEWANEEEVRRASFLQKRITFTEHCEWFRQRLNDPNSILYLFEYNAAPIGQVRFQKNPDLNKAIISTSIDEGFRGRGLSASMLAEAIETFLSEYPQYTIVAFIKRENKVSRKAFSNAGFTEVGQDSKKLEYHYKKQE